MTLDIPSGFLTSVASSTTAMIGSLSGIAALIIGVLLALLVVEYLVGIARKDEGGV
jgi:hypothetical protein